jgi:hypothetical protein
MRKFDPETAISAIELHQLMAEFGHELDVNGGLNITQFYTEDCNYVVGGNSFRGHPAVAKFYADRGERVRTQQKDGARTQRHAITNLRISFEGKNQATVNYLMVNYSAAGNAPIMDFAGPSVVADCRMACRREVDGLWRIAEFTSAPVFVGNDPFLNAAVLQK